MGLRVRMAASYVLVTLGAVLLVEAALLALSARVISDRVSERELAHTVLADAYGTALRLSSQASATGGAGFPSGTAAPSSTPEPTPTAGGRFLPASIGSCTAAQKAGFTLLIDTDGTLLDSTFPDCYRAGARAPRLPTTRSQDGGLGDGVAGNRAAWAVAPVVQVPPDTFDRKTPEAPADLLAVPKAHRVATVYIERPTAVPSATGVHLVNIRPLVVPGLVVLAAALPVGLLFGYVSMRRPVWRLRRLADAAQAIARGDLDRRVEVTGRDELSQLEADINRMAERLAAALIAERELAAARARSSERARIARELHDAISQELFSLRLLAGGVARALPAASPVRDQMRSLEQTAAAATREMQALLLELRPAALSGGGLTGAIEGLAATYRDRLGMSVRTSLAPPHLSPEREHALLRIAQEALANAVRHGGATEVAIVLNDEVLSVDDNGRGFDPGAPTTGMGMTLMRERAAEVQCALTVRSRPGEGTTVEVRLT